MATAADRSPIEVLDERAAPPTRTTPYGEDEAQVYDVRLPATGLAAPTGTTVVVVHGGFWKAEWDRAHAAPQAQAFADAGHHVAVVEYRRTGMRGGGWPATFADVSAAVDATGAGTMRAGAGSPGADTSGADTAGADTSGAAGATGAGTEAAALRDSAACTD